MKLYHVCFTAAGLALAVFVAIAIGASLRGWPAPNEAPIVFLAGCLAAIFGAIAKVDDAIRDYVAKADAACARMKARGPRVTDLSNYRQRGGL